MAVKRSSQALALLLALPSAGFALGVGDIHLLSSLNAPLDAEIELLDVAPDEVNTVQAQLASRESFAQNGLDWPALMANVQVRLVRTPDGRQIIKLKSNDPVSDPFLTFLVEVNWSHGHLMREFTVLLDPPVYAPQSQVAAAPVSAPTTGAGAREGAISRSSEPAPAAPAPAEPVATAPARSAASESSSSASAGASGNGAGSTRVVRPGDTLSHIAANVAGADATTARARAWMVAIYQANPQAFEQNMNLLRSGAVLRIPDAATASAISPADALATIRSQYASWHGAAAAAPSGGAAPSSAQQSAQQPGRLKLVTPSQGGAGGATPGSAASETNALQGRVHDLESQLAEQKRLLDLKNAELARMQAQLAAKQAPAAAPPAAPAPAPTPAPSAQAPAPQAAPPAATPAPEAQPAPQAAPPVPTPAPVAAAKPAPVPEATGGSFADTLKHYWWALLLVLVAVIAFVVSRVMGNRRESDFDDSLGRLGAGGPDSAPAAPRSFSPPEPARSAPARAASAAAAEPAFLVEESGSHERPRIGAAAPAPPAAPRHVTTDETISSETAINLDQGDPLAEADFHMAYGLYDQAADLIRIAIARDPNRRDLKLKLLEVYFVWGNKEQFLQTARELNEARTQAAPGEWEKILIMGKQLAPEDPMFSGAAPVSGAAEGGVDLDLEGGQSRVDFDLLGEPVAAENAQGLDLDIGAAADATSESPTNVTDRNELLEGTFSSTTGSTRQMTQRMRREPAEFEGPTVEQPSLATSEHPTVRQKVETALRHGTSGESTAELAIDDLGLDMDHADTVDRPGPASAAASSADSPTLVTGLDDVSKARAGETGSSGAWNFDQTELEKALTQTTLGPSEELSSTSRLAALKDHDVDVDVSDSTGTHQLPRADMVDLDVGAATGTHPVNGGLDLDVGEQAEPDAAFAATQRLSSEDLALPDLEPVTMSEVGTKLDLARAYMDMGDPDGARNILEEVLHEGSAAQKQEAQRLMESLPG